jgi:hypothetical protein
MVLLPNAVLLLRLAVAQRAGEKREIVIGTAEDHRDHLLVYLLAMLLPFYADPLATWRMFSAAIVAVAFVVFLFWSLNLHYMNIFFAMFGYRIFTISSPKDENPIAGCPSLVLISPRTSIETGERITAYRVSDTVYMEVAT